MTMCAKISYARLCAPTRSPQTVSRGEATSPPRTIPEAFLFGLLSLCFSSEWPPLKQYIKYHNTCTARVGVTKTKYAAFGSP